jgi:hypothetical protein
MSDPEIKPKRRKYNSLTDFEDCRRNLARLYRKAERGTVPWKDVASAATAMRALMEAIERHEESNKLAEVEEALLRLRQEFERIKEREREDA